MDVVLLGARVSWVEETDQEEAEALEIQVDWKDDRTECSGTPVSPVCVAAVATRGGRLGANNPETPKSLNFKRCASSASARPCVGRKT